MNTTKPHVLLCAPDHYGIEYEINDWMRRDRPSDRETAQQQWHNLRQLLELAGARVSLVSPVAGLPDMCFTANAGLVYQRRIVLSQFRPPERRGETPYFEAWFRRQGWETIRLPNELYFEGAGDALFCGETLFAGYRIRSVAQGQQRIGTLLGVRVLPLELVDRRFYHLDTCFCPLDERTALYFPEAFDPYAQRVLQASVPDLIPVSEADAVRFGCNAVVLGRTVITNSGCAALEADLRKRGFRAWSTPLDEFVKAGGSAKCLTLRLDGEQAAAWRTVGVETLAAATPVEAVR